VGAALTDGNGEVMLFSSDGKAIRFQEAQVRPMGRTARGVRGIRLSDAQRVIALIVPAADGELLMASLNGYGKRSAIAEFPLHGRGGQGVISMQLSERNGALVSVIQVCDKDHIMLISDQGTLVRTRCDETPLLGRNTQGVRLIKLAEGEHLVGVERIAEDEGDEESDDGETLQ
jgi:DNA gyrase subunit A